MEEKRVEIDEKELAKYANSYIGTFEILSKQGGNTIDAMIAAVAIMNSKLLILAAHGPESIPEKTKEEIIEAYQVSNRKGPRYFNAERNCDILKKTEFTLFCNLKINILNNLYYFKKNRKNS